MCAALRLEAYEDVLEPKAIYSLIALCAFYNRHYGQCSRAFIRLENLDGQSHEERAVFSDLAMAIFVSKAPVDPAPRRGANACGKCGQGDLRDWDSACSNCDARFEFCVATAQRVDERQPSWACRVCRHKVLNESKWKCCPLCHSKR
jgi:WD repeat-containing protein 35